MCGGDIISDFIGVKRGRKLAPKDIWSEIDPFSDLLGFDATANPHKDQQPPLHFDQKLPQFPDNKGMLCLLVPNQKKKKMILATNISAFSFLIIALF